MLEDIDNPIAAQNIKGEDQSEMVYANSKSQSY